MRLTPPAPHPHHHLPWRLRLRSGWPLLVWLAAAIAVYVLVWRDRDWLLGVEIHGIVGRETIIVAPEETARIQRILVAAGQHVTNNQPLVELDTASIEYQLADSLLAAQRTAQTIQDRRLGLQENLARRNEYVADLEARLGEARLEQAAAQAELERLQIERQERQKQFAQGLLDALGRDEPLARLSELEQAGAARQDLIRLYAAQLETARRQAAATAATLERSRQQDQDPAAIDAMLQDIARETQRYRDSYTLRSPCNGIVSEVRSEPGEVVDRTRTVMRIVPESFSTIVALIPESRSTLFAVGDRVYVSAINCREPGRVGLTATIDSLAPEVRVEAAMLNLAGRQVPMRTRRAMLRIDDPAASHLIAGEVVEVSRKATRPSLAGWLRGDQDRP